MKLFFLSATIFIFSQFITAQTKITEYERTDSDSESSQIDSLVEVLNLQPESTGFIRIYTGETESASSTIIRHAEMVKRYISDVRGIDPKRILVTIAKGKKPLFKELWVYSKDSLLPEIKALTFDLSKLESKYLYASVCAGCAPAVPQLSLDYFDLESYADLLKRYPAHKALIIIFPNTIDSQKTRRNEAINYAVIYRRELTEKYKISSGRITIKIAKSIEKDLPIVVDFYFVPDKKTKTNSLTNAPF